MRTNKKNQRFFFMESCFCNSLLLQSNVEENMESIETINECEFLDFFNSRTFNANCFNEDGSLNKNYNSFKSTGIIASIFQDHWDSTYGDSKNNLSMLAVISSLKNIFDSIIFIFIATRRTKSRFTSMTNKDSQFIMLLLRHLLPTQFKIIRYYGFYRKKHSIHSKR